MAATHNIGPPHSVIAAAPAAPTGAIPPASRAPRTPAAAFTLKFKIKFVEQSLLSVHRPSKRDQGNVTISPDLSLGAVHLQKN